MIASYNFLGLVCADVPASTEFFTDVLGFKVNAEESVPGIYSQFETQDGAVFSLVNGLGDAPAVQQPFDAALEVKDIESTFADLKAKGVEMVTEVQEMPFGRTFLFRTPDDHVLRVMQARA